METTINAFLVLDDGADDAVVDGVFPPGGKVAPIAFAEGLGEASRAVEDTSSDLLVVACNGTRDGIVELIRSALGRRPERPVVALCADPPDHFVRSMLAAGADDVVVLPETPERVAFALEKAMARRNGHNGNGHGPGGSMVCVLGPKGGTGKTVTASNLVVALAAAGRRAAIVDLDLRFGDVGLALGLAPQKTVYDLATSGGALDAEKLDAYLARHPSGARALLAPSRPDQAGSIRAELLRDVYSLLRATHDVVVVDTPRDFAPEVIAAIDACSHTCVVANLDSLSLKNTKLGLAMLELMDRDASSTTLVLNRADSDVGLAARDVEAIVGQRPDVLVPSNRAVPRSLNEGVPIVLGHKRSSVAAAFRSLAGAYMPQPSGNGRRWRGRRARRNGGAG